MTEIKNDISYTTHKIYDNTKFVKIPGNPYKYNNIIEYFADDDLFVNNKTNYTVTIYPDGRSNPISYIYGIPGKGATFSGIFENTVSIKDGRIRGLYNPVSDDEPVNKKYLENKLEENKVDVPAALENKGIMDLAVSNLYFGAYIDPSTHDYELPIAKLYDYIEDENEYNAFRTLYSNVPFENSIMIPLFVMSRYSAHFGFFILYTDSNQKCHWKDMNGNEFLTSN